MRIVTWNLWWQFGPWRERQPLIVQELRQLDPDVVCIQEVWSDETADQAEELATALGYNMVRTTTAEGDPQSFGNAILSRFEVERAGQIALPNADGLAGHRSVLAAWVQLGQHRQLVVNTHLEWRYSQSALRQQQLGVVVDYIAELRSIGQTESGTTGPGSGDSSPTPDAVILAGDLNAVPESQEIRKLTGLEPPYRTDLIFTDAWAATSDEPGYTWTRENPNSSEAMWPRRRLDYVLVSWPRPKPWANPVSARLAGTSVVDRPGPQGVEETAQLAPSDHYAVVVELDNRQTLGHG